MTKRTYEQQEAKECKMRRQEVKKLRIWKPQSAKRFMKLVWKVHEVARGKVPLSWNWGVSHFKSV